MIKKIRIVIIFMPLFDGEVIFRLIAIHASTIIPRNKTPTHPNPNFNSESSSQAVKKRIMHGLFSCPVEKNPFMFISVATEPPLQKGFSGVSVVLILGSGVSLDLVLGSGVSLVLVVI